MTARPFVALHCDHPGCTAAVVTGQRRMADARREADAGGWSATVPATGWRGERVMDFCPEHGPGAGR